MNLIIIKKQLCCITLVDVFCTARVNERDRSYENQMYAEIIISQTFILNLPM